METLSRDVTWLRSDAFLKNHRSPDNLKRNCSKFSEATLFVSIPPYSLQPCPRSAQPVPVPPPCTARGSAAPLPSSHRGVHRALTVEDDTGTSSQGPHAAAGRPRSSKTLRPGGPVDVAFRNYGRAAGRPRSPWKTPDAAAERPRPPWLLSPSSRRGAQDQANTRYPAPPLVRPHIHTDCTR